MDDRTISDLDADLKKIFNILYSHGIMIKLRDTEKWKKVSSSTGKIMYISGKLKALKRMKSLHNGKDRPPYQLWIEYHSKEMEDLLNGRKTMNEVFSDLTEEILSLLQKLIKEIVIFIEYFTSEYYINSIVEMSLAGLCKDMTCEDRKIGKTELVKRFIKDIYKSKEKFVKIIEYLNEYLDEPVERTFIKKAHSM